MPTIPTIWSRLNDLEARVAKLEMDMYGPQSEMKSEEEVKE